MKKKILVFSKDNVIEKIPFKLGAKVVKISIICLIKM